MESSESRPVDSVANSAEQASIKDVLPSLERWFNAWQLRWQAGKSLVAADIRLSIRAIVLCAMTALLMVAVSSILWLVINLALVIAMHSWQIHWGIIATVMLVLNGVILQMLLAVFRGAFKSISLQGSLTTLMEEQQSSTESQQSGESSCR